MPDWPGLRQRSRKCTAGTLCVEASMQQAAHHCRQLHDQPCGLAVAHMRCACVTVLLTDRRTFRFSHINPVSVRPVRRKIGAAESGGCGQYAVAVYTAVISRLLVPSFARTPFPKDGVEVRAAPRPSGHHHRRSRHQRQACPAPALLQEGAPLCTPPLVGRLGLFE